MAKGAGRDRKKEVFWRRMVRGQARNGLSIRAWCGRHRLPEASFYWWRRQLAQRDAAMPTFLPVQVRTQEYATAATTVGATAATTVGATAGAGRLEIVLAGNCRVHVVGPVDRQALADVLAVLTSAQALAAEVANDVRQPLREMGDDDVHRSVREATPC